MPDPSRHNKVIQNEHAEQTRKINEERNKPKNPFEDIVREIGETVGSAVAEAAHEVYIPVHHKDEKQEQPQPELPKLDPTTVPNFTTLTDKASAVEAYHAFNFKFAGDLQKDSVTTPGKTREERTKERLDKNIKDMWEDAEKCKADREHRAGNYFFNNSPLGYMLSADAAAKNLVNNGEINPDAERNLKVIQDIFHGKYSFGVTAEEFEEWQKKAYKKTGNYLMNPDGSFQLDPFGNKIPETVLRSDAPPPPIGTDAANYDRWMKKNTYLTQEWDEKKGKWKDVRYLNPDADDVPVQASEFKKYWDWYMQYNKDLDVEHKMAEEKKHYMAGVDPDASDSLLDVVRDGFSGKQDIFTGAYKYFDNYVFNPLKQGDWGTLGMNTLVNLGETMDLFGVGLRAIVGAQDTLKYDGRHIIKGQNEFVYSSGKKKQKELMEHGAGDLIRYREGLGGKYSVDAKAAEIKAELQKAGLWDEYLKLEAEWNLHDNKGSIPENLKAAYTTHENFEGDTGSTLKNLVVETLLDPSLLVGGSAKIASSAGSKAAAKGALKAAIEGVDDLATKEFVDFINVGKGAVKTYMREVGEGIVMKNSDTIKTAVENFADRAIKEGMFVPENKDVFVGLVKEAIGDIEHNAEYRFIQSLGSVDRMVDKMDSILLKSSFVVPYAPFKTITMARKTLRNTERYANWKGMRKGQRELQAMRDLFEGLVEKDGRVNIGNFDEVTKRMHDNAWLRGDDNLRNTVVQKLTKDMSDHVSMMKRVTDQLASSNYSPDQIEELLNVYIRNVTNGKVTSIDDFKDYIDNIFNEGADRFKGALDNMKQTLDNQFKNFERTKEIVVENFKTNFYKELSKANSFEELQELASAYKKFANYVDGSFEEDLVLKANEFIDQTVTSADDMIRKFEFKDATSVYEPSAVIDDILKGIEEDKTSKYLNKLHPDTVKKVEEFVKYLQDNFYELTKTDKKLVWDIFFDEDFDFHEARMAAFKQVNQEKWNKFKTEVLDVNKPKLQALWDSSQKLRAEIESLNLDNRKHLWKVFTEKLETEFVDDLYGSFERSVDSDLDRIVELGDELRTITNRLDYLNGRRDYLANNHVYQHEGSGIDEQALESLNNVTFTSHHGQAFKSEDPNKLKLDYTVDSDMTVNMQAVPTGRSTRNILDIRNERKRVLEEYQEHVAKYGDMNISPIRKPEILSAEELERKNLLDRLDELNRSIEIAERSGLNDTHTVPSNVEIELVDKAFGNAKRVDIEYFEQRISVEHEIRELTAKQNELLVEQNSIDDRLKGIARGFKYDSGLDDLPYDYSRIKTILSGLYDDAIETDIQSRADAIIADKKAKLDAELAQEHRKNILIQEAIDKLQVRRTDLINSRDELKVQREKLAKAKPGKFDRISKDLEKNISESDKQIRNIDDKIQKEQSYLDRLYDDLESYRAKTTDEKKIQKAEELTELKAKPYLDKIEKYNKRLEELQKQREDRVSRLEKRKMKIGAVDNRDMIAQLDSRIANFDAEIKRVEESLKENYAKIPTASVDDLRVSLEQAISNRKKYIADFDKGAGKAEEFVKELDRFDNNISRLKSLIENADKAGSDRIYLTSFSDKARKAKRSNFGRRKGKVTESGLGKADVEFEGWTPSQQDLAVALLDARKADYNLISDELTNLKQGKFMITKEHRRQFSEIAKKNAENVRKSKELRKQIKANTEEYRRIKAEQDAAHDRIYEREADIDQLVKDASRSLEDMNPRELRTKLVEAIREKELKMACGNYNPEAKTVDQEFIKQCKNLIDELDKNQLNLSFSDDMELLDLHCDIFNIFNKYISDGRFTDARNALETSGIFEKLDYVINSLEAYYEMGGEESIIKSLPKEFVKLVDLRDRLHAQTEILKAYDNLTIELKKIPGLSENQYWTVLDSIFGFTKNNPSDFFIKASREPERLIEKINLNMDTLFGRSRVSLDGFRYEARNYSSELWEDYADEIVDPDIQQRVENILSDGHLNPDKDVQTQMLQLILRDREAINYYNELAKEQAVLFTDIETEGLNSSLYGITDIAYRRWEPDVITSESSLKDILDFIEGSGSSRYTSKQLNDDIRNTITTQTLEGLFKDTPNAGRGEMLEEYCRIYGTSDASEVVSESDLLKKFVVELDRFYDEFDGKTPVLVTHSNRGFDKKFIRDRIVHYKQENIDVTPSHIVHLQDLVDASESTVERLKGLTDDIILTSTQASMVEDTVVGFSRSISDYTDNMKVLDPDVFEDFFELESRAGLFEEYTGISATVDFAIERNTIDPKVKQVLREISDYYGSPEFLQIRDNYRQMAKEIHSETRRFNNNMLYEGSRGTSLFKKSFDAGDSVIPEVGYDVVGSVRGERSAGKYFGVPSTQKVNVDSIQKMTSFTKEVDNILRYQLRQNTLIPEYEEEFRRVIRYAKGYAINLSEADPLYYFRYIQEPDTAYEAFAMAQIIWDKTLKFADEDTLQLYTQAYMGLGFVRDDVKDYVLSYVMSGKEFDLSESVSGYVLDILKGHTAQDIIYKHGIPVLYHPKITKPLESAKDFLAMQAKADQNLRAHTSYTNTVEGFVDEAEDYAIKTAHETMIEIGDDIKRMEEESISYHPKHGWETSYVIPTFIDVTKRQFDKRRRMMTRQILDYVTASEDNLIGHLLFHNHQLHIPIKGDATHAAQVTALRTLLTGLDEGSPIVFKEHNGFIHIGINKDVNIRITNDSRHADEKATQIIDGRDVVYSAPEYKVISNELPSENELDIWINNYLDRLGLLSSEKAEALSYISFNKENYVEIMAKMQKVYDQIDFLTEGKSVGSVGTLHTLSRQKQIFKNLPKDFLDEILTEETTCDARFWHQASFDMTCLGDSDNMWKYTDYNDADPVLSLYNTLEEVTGSASAERMYLGYWNHPDSPYRLDSMFNDVDDAEKINILNNMTDTVVVNFTAKDTAFFGGLKSKTGVEVNALEIKDLTDLRRAEASGAIVVPYELYLDMQEVFNKSEITDTISGKVMKAWTKCIWLYKVGQLSNPGTWIRNWIDATMKMTGETGDIGQTARCQLKAFHSLATYKTITKKIKKISDLNYTSAKDIEREYSKLPERYRNMMSYEEYKFIDDWLKVSIAGGESRTLKSIEDYSNSAVNLNAALKQGSTQGILTQRRLDELKQGYDLIGDKIQRFEELGEDEIKSLIYESNTWLWNDLSKGRFMQIFREGQDIATDEELFEYNKICNQLIEDRFKRIRGDRKVSNVINHTANYLLTPMSGVEEVVRLAQYMALEEQGYTRNQVFKSIVSSQFNYDNKSMRAKMLEMFIPYYGFMDANLSYWCKSLDKNPRMLRYVEHIWGELSWDAAMQFGEDPEQNQSVNYMMGHGGIPIGDSGMYLKTEPSFLQPINLMLGSPSEYMNTLATPFQFGIKALLGTGGSEYSALFHELSNSQGDVQNEFLNSLPIIGSAKTRYYDHFTAENPRWERLEDANFIERNLVKFNPSLFGAIKRYQTDKEDAYMSFQQSLAAQGKWWDQNLQRAVPISEMNTDGLNNPNLSFDERAELIFLYQNKLWDANKEQFVDVDNFEAGGLNQEFNLDNPGEWEKLCELKEDKRNLKWDYNKRKWVDADKFEEIMLNDPNCSWKDNQRYHDELFGEKYDYNQGKYVQKEQYIKGGLNDEYGSHTFSELCALQYALHGKEYIRGEGFVKTGEPIVQYDIPETDLDRTILYDRTDPVTKMLARLGLVEETYADTLPKLSTTKKGIEGRWVLNGNPAHDSKIFEEIMDVYADKAPTFDNSTRFHNWTGTTWRKYNSGWREFADLPELPKAARYAMKPQKKVKFGYSYTSGGEYAALRTALYGTQVYEDYYRFEFSYNYNYRSPSAGPKKYAGSLYRAGQYRLRGGQNRIKDKWRYYTR